MLGEDEEMPVLEILEGGAETDCKKMLPMLPIKNIRTSGPCCRSLCLGSAEARVDGIVVRPLRASELPETNSLHRDHVSAVSIHSNRTVTLFAVEYLGFRV